MLHEAVAQRRLPRLALAIPSAGQEPSLASLALMAVLSLRGYRVQHFRALAGPPGSALVQEVTGLPGRHVDPWLMPAHVCREVFLRGCRQSDIALVEGTLEQVRKLPHPGCPGFLGPLVECLCLPVVAVLPCPRRPYFHLGTAPPCADAILLDGLEAPEDAPTVAHLAELVYKKPVIGIVRSLPELSGYLAEASGEGSLSEEDVGALARALHCFAGPERLFELAAACPLEASRPEHRRQERRRFRVAYALDEAFGSYCQDTLETLESLGAELVDFSPIRDESVPEGADLVLIGCGHPERYAEALAANVSMLAGLKHHVCRGRWAYSEGGGTAYLGRSMHLGTRRFPGADILPFDAHLRPSPRGSVPVRRTLLYNTWMGPGGTEVKGYRSGNWTLRPTPDPEDYVAHNGSLTAQQDMYFRKNAVGSLIHLHFGSLPEVVDAITGSRIAPLVPGVRPLGGLGIR